MKPFDQWVDEIRAQNNHEVAIAPGDEDSDYTTDCEGNKCSACDGKGWTCEWDNTGTPYQEECPWCYDMKCSGPGCSKTGKANYDDGGRPLYYCGGSPLCCP